MVFHSLSIKREVELPDSKSTHIKALKFICMYWNLLYMLVPLDTIKDDLLVYGLYIFFYPCKKIATMIMGIKIM